MGEVVDAIKRGDIQNGGDIYRVISQLGTEGGMAMVTRNLTLFLMENFAEICMKLARGLLNIVSNLVSDALKWIGEELAKLEWWKKLTAIVGRIVVGGVAVALGASVAAGVGMGAAGAVALRLLMLLL